MNPVFAAPEGDLPCSLPLTVVLTSGTHRIAREDDSQQAEAGYLRHLPLGLSVTQPSGAAVLRLFD